MKFRFDPTVEHLDAPPAISTKLTKQLLESLLTVSNAESVILNFPEHGIIIVARLAEPTKQFHWLEIPKAKVSLRFD